MNLVSPWSATSRYLFRVLQQCRRWLPARKCHAFGSGNCPEYSRIERIYVINLDRQPDRWAEIEQELRTVSDYSGEALWKMTERAAAVDSKHFLEDPVKDNDIDPVYTLGDQLFVEPQPSTLPTKFDLDDPIRMSHPEIAVTRSHINVWRKTASCNHDYVLILEDDVWFRPGFAQKLDNAWREIIAKNTTASNFDILYLSYEEVLNGAPKTFLSKNVFCPVRGLWHLSGYVLSRKGALKLLQLLPCRGPVDLWMNQQFRVLNVIATRRSIITQRHDGSSTNSYSILPSLTKIGAITSESASLFNIRPKCRPVFAFGPEDSGLSSLATALSMLGYRCCSDLDTLPSTELSMLLSGRTDRVFDAYVNIGTLSEEVRAIRQHYAEAKIIVTANTSEAHHKVLNDLDGADIVVLPKNALNKWQRVCEHLRSSPPPCSFPEVPDKGIRKLLHKNIDKGAVQCFQIPERDKSPWVAENLWWWHGIQSSPSVLELQIAEALTDIYDCLAFHNTTTWHARTDTFTDNLALFKPDNVSFTSDQGAALQIKKESLGVRNYSAGSLTSCEQFLYGRFEATIRASDVPGVITGFFLYRDSPRQEIDIEIAGNRPDRLIVNVFYNPGCEGVKFDYGYRGAPTYIDLGFDTSKAHHLFAIEWGPTVIRWFVDNKLVHSRVSWDPTPIPDLPMALHVNSWPCRSKELAGRLNDRRLPATTYIRSMAVKANTHQRLSEL